MERFLEEFKSSILELKTQDLGIGGNSTLSFFDKTKIKNIPRIGLEVESSPPQDWPPSLIEELKEIMDSPYKWAEEAIRRGADIISFRATGIHPDRDLRNLEEELEILRELSKKINVPLILLGTGIQDIDRELFVKASSIFKGKKIILGKASQEEYKTLTALCISDGHNLVAQSPVDVNIAKQLNILITEEGLDLKQIIMDPTVGALGYGLEYTYSVMERIRLAGLNGDTYLSPPFICFVGEESWKVKESYAQEKDFPKWGNENIRGVNWEVITSLALLVSGADIIVVRSFKSLKILKEIIKELCS